MKKYVFITNSSKPSEEEYESLNDVVLNSVSQPCLSAAVKMGYEVYLGVNRKNAEVLHCCELPLSFYNSNTFRSIFNVKDNFKAYRNLCNLLKNGDFKVIHCNTPIGGIIGRICGRKFKIDTVIYTVHGFHFFDGAPLMNNTFFKWAEFFMAKWTDVIITLNEEDYRNAKKMKLKKNGEVYKISGVGIDTDFYKNINNDGYREKLRLQNDDFVCISVGDVVPNKNYYTAIESISKINDKKVHLIICGEGPQREYLEGLVHKLNLDSQIHFLGFRKDIKELLYTSDCFLFTSKREGLPRSIMEAMAVGKPCICSDIRGNRDLIDENGGFLIKNNDSNEYIKAIKTLKDDTKLKQRMGNYNKSKINEFSSKRVNEQIKKIYSKHLL